MNDDLTPNPNQSKPDFSVTIDAKDNITETTVSSISPRTHFSKLRSKQPFTKKEKIIIIIELAIIVICIGILVFALTRSTAKPVAPKPVAKAVVTAPKAPVIVSRLSGLPVTAAQEALPVTGVMIENSLDARPQSGLSQAGVVYEAIAEGGITRFLALYEDNEPSSLGPIRSARPYYVGWLLPFDASYAHVGGSPDGLSAISQYNVKNLDEFYNGSSYYRITSREAPHNVYTSMSNLIKLEQSKGYATSTFTGFPRKVDQPSVAPTATKINFNIAGSDYDVSYNYDKTNNSYGRSEGGSPMIDANTNQQLDPKVVIAIVVPVSQGALDASGAYYSEYAYIGTGRAYVFQDGNVVVGTWTKTSESSQIVFNTTTGGPIPLDAGQTWITAVGASNLVTYSD
jgi:hypothetical protein